ncbi:glycosyltransferase family 4 protein [Bisgaard Taxon 10/6]|uniref:glycosyltransferase family 4 protein n=1 Tax=Exercitatus varius TaxID=67857 RepID=UPI00294B26C1|nr:glycosyltransferase family 4 protein [Exercitatus varius]MDG2960983.1 glycosyltransferase family 4 protein [Exercitatus varius]
MKILFLVDGLYNAGGTERVVCNLANLFSKELGCTVIIANRTTTKENVYFSLNDKIKVEALGKNYFHFYRNLNKFIKEQQPSIILIHNMGKLSLFSSFLKIPKNCKLLSLEHVAFQSRPYWVRILSKVVYKKYHQIIALTQNDKMAYSVFHQNVISIPNISAYDVTTLNNVYNTKSKKVIAVGRLTYQKNFLALLTAWKGIQERYSGWDLAIYGEGEDRKVLEEYITENKLTTVTLKGNQTDLSDAYKKASFLVMSSHYEGFGLVLIEAQSFGLPLISFDCPYGPSEIIKNNHNGYLVENQNIKLLENKIADMMNQEERRALFSKNAKEDALRFSSAAILEQWKYALFK